MDRKVNFGCVDWMDRKRDIGYIIDWRDRKGDTGCIDWRDRKGDIGYLDWRDEGRYWLYRLEG